MDKKTKKRITILRERIQKLEKMLAGAKQQQDDPDEVGYLEREIAQARTDLDTLLGR